MARKKITADLNGGDVITAKGDLVFQVHDAADDSIIATANYLSIGSVNSPGSDAANITYTLNPSGGAGAGGQIILDGVEVGTATSLKIRCKDEAGNESTLSAAASAGYKMNFDDGIMYMLTVQGWLNLDTDGNYIEMKWKPLVNAGSQYPLGRGSGPKLLYGDGGVLTIYGDDGISDGGWSNLPDEVGQTTWTFKIVRNGTALDLYIDGVFQFGNEVTNTFANWSMIGRFSTAEWKAELHHFETKTGAVIEHFACNEGTGNTTTGDQGTVFTIENYVDDSIWVGL